VSCRELVRYVTREEFKETLLPAIDRGMLRNPEIILEGRWPAHKCIYDMTHTWCFLYIYYIGLSHTEFSLGNFVLGFYHK